MPAITYISPAYALSLCFFALVSASAQTNLVVNGNFTGGVQSSTGQGNDTVPNGWTLLAADNTNLHVQTLNGAGYAVFDATPTAADLANGYMNGIGVPNGGPDQDCLFQPVPVIAGQQYTVSFTVQITGATGLNTLLIPVWNWSPQIGTQQFMMNPLYGSYAASNAEFSPASGTGSVQVTFTETAPDSDLMPAGSSETVNLMFHGSGVAGGQVLLTNVVVTPAAVPQPPSILASGIVPIYSTSTTIQPGEWVSIFGSNLASATATWSGNFPTNLGNTTVMIDGKPAYLSMVSSGQINLQAPDDTFTGNVPVVVTTPAGNTTSTVTLAQFAPSFLLLDSKHVSAIIFRSDGSGAYGGGTYDILGPTGSSLGYQTVAAKAGDTVELYGTGFGPTVKPVPAGQAFSGAEGTATTVNLVINGVPVAPGFAGLSGPGLDQINFTVPSGLGSGDIPLAASVGGVSTQSGVVISLR